MHKNANRHTPPAATRVSTMAKPNFTAENIAFLCERDGISPHKLSECVAIDSSTLYRLMDTQIRPNPRLRTLKALADYFHVDPYDLRQVDLRARSMEEGAHQSDLFDFRSLPESKPQNLIPKITITDFELFDPEKLRTDLGEFTDELDKTRPLGFIVSSWNSAPSELTSKNLISYEVVGSAMEPKFKDRDVVYVSKFDDCIWGLGFDVKNGDCVLASFYDGTNPSVGIRSVAKDEFGRCWAVALNPAWLAARQPIRKILGKVVGVFRLE